MRTFSAFEKKIINKLLTLDKDNSNSICVQNILADENGIIGKPTDFEFNIGGEKKLSIYYYKDINKLDENEKKLLHNLEKQLFDFVLLMNYLIDENYILKIPQNLHSGLHVKIAYDREIQLNSKLASMLGQLWDNEFKVLFKIEELKKHNFLDSVSYKEETNRRITIAIAFASIIGTLISGLINPIISCHTAQKISVI